MKYIILFSLVFALAFTVVSLGLIDDISAEFENGSYLLFYDEQAQIELYSQKYNLDETTKMAKSLIGID